MLFSLRLEVPTKIIETLLHAVLGEKLPGVPNIVPTLTPNIKAVTTLMSGNSGFPVSSDLYNSFDTLLICCYGLVKNWQ